MNNVANHGDPGHDEKHIKQMRPYWTSSVRQVMPPSLSQSQALSAESGRRTGPSSYPRSAASEHPRTCPRPAIPPSGFSCFQICDIHTPTPGKTCSTNLLLYSFVMQTLSWARAWVWMSQLISVPLLGCLDSWKGTGGDAIVVFFEEHNITSRDCLDWVEKDTEMKEETHLTNSTTCWMSRHDIILTYVSMYMCTHILPQKTTRFQTMLFCRGKPHFSMKVSMSEGSVCLRNLLTKTDACPNR